ncbi:hypothetical protein Taro_050486 [Colocasia esculenta]|uniref:Core Histone H2A/H2B/H3 domain-containing protein n=1 Tax=Colocasia esculenta TaxID=4460 RepID=A0A843XE33_COLES|nr:hypothetical protein [Colocasia esculenta]
MDQSVPQSQPVMGIVTGAAQIAYAAPPYQPAAVVATGAPAVIGAVAAPNQPASSYPTSPGQIPSQHQLAYQQVQQFHHQQLQQQQQQLQEFWANQIVEIENTTDFKNHSLPLARIKKIMKADEDVRMISAEAPVIFAKACEMFILELTLRSWIHTEENKRRTLQKNDIAAAITRTDIFDFLVDIVPRDELKEEGLGIPRAALPAVGAPPDAIPYYYVQAQHQVAPPGMIMGKPVDQSAASAAAIYASQQPHTVAYMPWPQPQGQPSSQQQQPQEMPESSEGDERFGRLSSPMMTGGAHRFRFPGSGGEKAGLTPPAFEKAFFFFTLRFRLRPRDFSTFAIFCPCFFFCNQACRRRGRRSLLSERVGRHRRLPGGRSNVSLRASASVTGSARGVEELAAGRDQEDMAAYAEQIAVTSYVTYTGEGAPPAELKGRPAGARATEKRPLKINLRKEFASLKRAARQDEESEEEDAAPQLQKKKRKLVKAAEQARPRVVPELRSAATERMILEMGLGGEDLVVVSDHSEGGSNEEQMRVQLPQDLAADRAGEAGAAETPSAAADGEGVAEQRSAPEEVVEAATAAVAPGRATEPVPSPEVAMEGQLQRPAASMPLAGQTTGSEEAGLRKAPVAGESQEVEADAGATGAVGGVVTPAEQTAVAAEGRAGSEEDRALSQLLKTKSLVRPSETVLEAALERLQGSASRSLPPAPGLSPEDASERTKVQLEECRSDKDGEVDVEALVDGVTRSLGVLKKFALRAQYHQQMWDAEFAFYEEREEQHQRQEAELRREVKNLRIALRASELDLTVARAEKAALARVLSEAETRGVAEYKAGPEFQEDLEQYGTSCYKVGLQVGEDRGRCLATDDYAREAFEAALQECQ